MILPGTFPLPFVQRKSGKAPFSYSGSWETGDEGWVRSPDVDYRSNNARTGTYCFSTNDNGAYADYVLAAGTCDGLTLVVSVWHKTFGTATRRIQAKIGSGSFFDLDSVTDASTTYAQMSGSFSGAGAEEVTIRLFWDAAGTTAFMDDWSISGS